MESFETDSGRKFYLPSSSPSLNNSPSPTEPQPKPRKPKKKNYPHLTLFRLDTNYKNLLLNYIFHKKKTKSQVLRLALREFFDKRQQENDTTEKQQ